MSTPLSTQQTAKPKQTLRVGVGGPVGSGKTALLRSLCSAMREHYDIAVVTNGSEEHTSELQSRGLISYAVFCLKKKKKNTKKNKKNNNKKKKTKQKTQKKNLGRVDKADNGPCRDVSTTCQHYPAHPS